MRDRLQHKWLVFCTNENGRQKRFFFARLFGCQSGQSGTWQVFLLFKIGVKTKTWICTHELRICTAPLPKSIWMARFAQLCSYSTVHNGKRHHNFGSKKSHKEFGSRKVLHTGARYSTLLTFECVAWRGWFADGKVNNGTNGSTGRFLDFSSAPVLRARARAKTSWEWNNKAKWKSIRHLFDILLYTQCTRWIRFEDDGRIDCVMYTRIRRERGHCFCFGRRSVAAAPNQYAVNKRKLFCFCAQSRGAGERILTAASENTMMTSTSNGIGKHVGVADKRHESQIAIPLISRRCGCFFPHSSILSFALSLSCVRR